VNPKVSVLVPTYNYARYLPQAIESVLSQTFRDFELVVVDDASGDGSADVVAPYAAADGRIAFSANPVNLGMVENWNRCLRKARGEYVKFLFGDDLLSSPEALARMVEVLDAHPGVALVASARNIVDSDSRTVDVWSHFGEGAVVRGTELINDLLKEQRNLIGEPTAVMFRRADASRGFDVRYRQIVDLEMWIHLLEKGDFAYLSEPLVSFRVHPAQQTEANRADFRARLDGIRLMSDYQFNPRKGYVRMGAVDRWFTRFHSYYLLRRDTPPGGKDRELAIRIIREQYGYRRFWGSFVLYKVYNPVRKILGSPFRHPARSGRPD
jgi:glycosyltransferase involved in cell wall biosynthesis